MGPLDLRANDPMGHDCGTLADSGVANDGPTGFLCGLVMVAAVAFYWRLSHALGAAMLVVFIVFGALTEWLYRSLGPTHLLWLAIGVFAAAWIGQFVGHMIEGRRPSFLTNLAYLLIGPAWLTGKIMRRIGIAY
jgi:uncharacterized membrane protein YGL010W